MNIKNKYSKEVAKTILDNANKVLISPSGKEESKYADFWTQSKESIGKGFFSLSEKGFLDKKTKIMAKKGKKIEKIN